MQCQHCGKSDWVTIGNQKYCANCGESSTPEASPSTNTIQPTPPIPVVTPKPVVTEVSNPLPALTPSTISAPATTAQTSDSTPSMNDVKPAPTTTPVPILTRDVKPAVSFHNAPPTSTGGVLDLREAKITPPPTAPEPAPATAAPLTTPSPTSALPIVPDESLSNSTPTTQPLPTPSTPPVTTTSSIQTPSVVTPPSPQSITKEASTITAPAINQTPKMVDLVNVPTTPPSTPSSNIQKFVRPDTIAPAVVVTSVVDASQPAGELPNHVVTQIESLKKLIPSQATQTPVPTDFKQSLASPPRAQSIMAATVAIVLMGGYIWLNNFNNLSVKSASKKAGIEASFPGYVPNSFSLNGPVSYGPGFVTLGFKSPNSASPLTITQQKTTWDSAALLQMFVNTKAKSYVSVANQGLTIYLYNNNQATWVNKGLQYVISGDTRLSRDQVLKIATSM